MPYAVDYSFSRPGAGAIRGAGYVGALRYLSGGSNSKDITSGELAELHGEGLGVGFVWETSGSRMDGGYGAGAQDGAAANAQADRLGLAPGQPIYFANDQNTCWQAHVDYMRGARDASRRPVGPYGNTELINRCHDELGCQYGWRVSTWGPSSPWACLVQEANMRPALGGTDVDSIWRDDWGQLGSIAPPAPPPPPWWKLSFEEEETTTNVA